jgi:hypothetical protein
LKEQSEKEIERVTERKRGRGDRKLERGRKLKKKRVGKRGCESVRMRKGKRDEERQSMRD